MSLSGINYPKEIPFSPRDTQKPSLLSDLYRSTPAGSARNAVKALKGAKRVCFNEKVDYIYIIPDLLDPLSPQHQRLFPKNPWK